MEREQGTSIPVVEPRSSFIDVDGFRLHYLEWEAQTVGLVKPGQGALWQGDNDNVPVVLLHGLGSSADSWRLIAPELSAHHTLIAFDLRGHGLSDQPTSEYNLMTLAEDTISAMAALGLGQVAVVGHGIGGRVAMVLTARHPALVSHLVLVDCPLIEPRHWPGMTRERFINEREISGEVFASREAYISALREEMAAFWSSEIEEIMLQQLREREDGHLEERLQREHQREIRASLWDDRAITLYSKLACPVLLVPAAMEPQPEGELPENLVSADEFAVAKGYMTVQVARMLQRSSIYWMPNTSHYIQLQRPQELAQAIVSFLQEG